MPYARVGWLGWHIHLAPSPNLQLINPRGCMLYTECSVQVGAMDCKVLGRCDLGVHYER